jgi:hypothetical protein
MVLTRRQAREDQLAKERKAQELEVQSRHDGQDAARHLSRVNTRIEIVPSATGQGVHTRWIRQHPTSAQPAEPGSEAQLDVILDERYITPAPTSIPTPGAPQKARGNPGRRAAVVSPPTWKLAAAMPNIDEEPEVDRLGESSDILGSPFPGHGTWNPRPICMEPTVLVLAEPSPVGRTDTEIVEDTGSLRRAYGPSGTHLYNSRGEPIFV